MSTNRSLVLGALALLAVPSAALAQDPPAPPPQSKAYLEGGLTLAFPSGDLEDGSVTMSPGLRLGGGIRFSPNLSAHGTLRYISISFEEDIGDVDYSNYDIGGGLRGELPVSPTLTVFFDADLFLSTLRASDSDESESENGLGFGFRAGGIIWISPKLGVSGAFSYTTATIDGDVFELDLAWVALEGSIVVGL